MILKNILGLSDTSKLYLVDKTICRSFLFAKQVNDSAVYVLFVRKIDAHVFYVRHDKLETAEPWCLLFGNQVL